VIRNFVARELAIRYSLNCPPSCELRTPRSPEVHAVPKYTHSGITRSPGVHEGHEVDCATQSQRYSLKSMRDVLNKDSMTAITAIRLTTTMSAMAGCATISRTQTLRTVTSMPLPASPALLSRGANVESQCSGWKSSATDPLHPNSSKTNAPSGVAERPPFFVKLSRFAGVSEGQAEREPAGEIPSAAEGSLLSRFAGVTLSLSKGQAERESAGEIPSAAEGSLVVAFLRCRQQNAALSCRRDASTHLAEQVPWNQGA